ncbi:MAG: ribosome silencing factor [Lachnospiraceae bacterium]|nr:ribosome silencing factor [Lachnospiraceae bacterium]
MTNDIAKKMALAAIDALQDKKAEDIQIIDIHEVSPLADYFIIANGTNRNQVQALADNVEELLGRLGYERRPVEGYDSANWILLDYKDVIIHIFDRENRSFYDLERIWRDGKQVTEDDLKM